MPRAPPTDARWSQEVKKGTLLTVLTQDVGDTPLG